MIADLKPYPAMKESGVPWLGKVPEHWGIWKLRSVLRRVTERNRPGPSASLGRSRERCDPAGYNKDKRKP